MDIPQYHFSSYLTLSSKLITENPTVPKSASKPASKSRFGPKYERVLKRLSRRASLLRVEVEAPIQKIRKEVEFLDIDVVDALCDRQQSRLQVSSRFREAENLDYVFAGQFILLDAPEVQEIVKVKAGELSFPKDLVTKLSPTFHDGA